jgi:hypothetical protein
MDSFWLKCFVSVIPISVVVVGVSLVVQEAYIAAWATKTYAWSGIVAVLIGGSVVFYMLMWAIWAG